MVFAGKSVQSRGTILVVDDNVALLRSVDRLLRMEEYDVWLAMDGEEALNELNDHVEPPDLIISDIAMPRMDGFQFYQAVRSNDDWTRVPFVFLTARDQWQDLETGYSLGADDYLIKPFDQERLLLIVRNKIERYRELARHIDVQRKALANMRRELSMVVAHELRTPLVSITMVSEMLADEFEKMDAEQVRELIDMMQHGSLRMNRLVEQMVFYVQLESGSLEEDIRQLVQKVTLSDLIQSAIDNANRWSYRQEANRIEMTLETPDLTLLCEQMALRHALAEVLFNAFVFSKPEDVIVLNQCLDDGVVRFEIIDQGRGMPASAVEEVFEPFVQYDRKIYEQQGIGIGLTLAKRLLSAHGGEITIESAVGEGTRVVIRVPVQPD